MGEKGKDQNQRNSKQSGKIRKSGERGKNWKIKSAKKNGEKMENGKKWKKDWGY